MNMKYRKAILYTSVLSIAYGSFFYQRYTFKHAVASPPLAMEEQTKTYSSHVMHQDAYSDEIETASDTQSYDMPEPPAKQHKQRVIKKNTATRASSSAAITVRPATRRTENSTRLSYSQEARNESSALRFTPTPVTPYSQSKTSSSQAGTTTTVEQSVAVSDGTEFLPDGSSQQDLFDSQSKNPRVYTIKDYQTADISCAPGYDDASSPHATLIRGLKGC